MPADYAGARAHAERLGAAVSADDLDLLREDPIEAIPLRYDVPVEVRPSETVGSRCSVAGSYIAEPTPHITIGTFASSGMTRFTALHELGHHLCRHDGAVQDWCFASNDERAEELVVDAFAAEVLLPVELVGSFIGARGPTARAVASLFGNSPASREACCVRAAQLLPGAGCVLVARGRVIQFASQRALPFFIARELEQDVDGFFDRIPSGGPTRADRLQILFRTGNYSSPLMADAALRGDYTFAVLVEHSPPWGGFSVRPTEDGPEGAEVECPHCDQAFETFARPCPRCGDRPCPRCRRCSCEPARPLSRRCRECNLELPRATPPGVDLCEDHR